MSCEEAPGWVLMDRAQPRVWDCSRVVPHGHGDGPGLGLLQAGFLMGRAQPGVWEFFRMVSDGQGTAWFRIALGSFLMDRTWTSFGIARPAAAPQVHAGVGVGHQLCPELPWPLPPPCPLLMSIGHKAASHGALPGATCIKCQNKCTLFQCCLLQR